MAKRRRSTGHQNLPPAAPSFEAQAKRIAQEWLTATAPQASAFTGLSAAKFNGYVLVMQFDLGRCTGVVAVETLIAEAFMETFTRAVKGPDYGVAPALAAGESVTEAEDGGDVRPG